MPQPSLLLDAALIRQLEQLELVVRRLYVGRMKGEKRSKRRGQGSEFADYRDYAQGDDLRHIDWNVYGRLDRLFVRLFHEEEDLRLSVYLDTSASMAHGDPQKLLYGEKIAAALAYIALANLDRVTIEAAHADGAEQLPATRGKQQVWRLLEFLDSVEAQGRTDLAAGLKQFSMRNRWPGMKVVISDFLDKRGWDGALKWMLRGNDQVVIVHVLSPQEVKPTIVGDLALEDCEDGSVTEISITGGLLKQYEANVKSLVGGLRDYCRTRGLAYYFAQSSVPVEQIVLTAMRRTGVLR
jgi:uncharacterized protein (DUF58 family)